MAAAPESPDSPANLLAAAYEQLGYNQGELLPALSEPQPSELKDWVDKGDWQTLAAQVGAESIFFVDRDPVVVFAKVQDSSPDTCARCMSACGACPDPNCSSWPVPANCRSSI